MAFNKVTITTAVHKIKTKEPSGEALSPEKNKETKNHNKPKDSSSSNREDQPYDHGFMRVQQN